MPERYLKNRSSYLMEVEYRLKTRSRMLGNLHVRYCEGENLQRSTYLDNQGLQLAKETGLQISQGALETLCQLTFDKGRLDAAFIENAYWLGLLRQQNQLRAENTEKLIKILQAQQNQNVDIEKLAKEAGLLSNEELVKKLSIVAPSTHNTNLHATVAAASNW